MECSLLSIWVDLSSQVRSIIDNSPIVDNSRDYQSPSEQRQTCQLMTLGSSKKSRSKDGKASSKASVTRTIIHQDMLGDFPGHKQRPHGGEWAKELQSVIKIFP